MADMTKIVSLPEEEAAKLRSDAAEFRANKKFSTGGAPKWDFTTGSGKLDGAQSMFLARQLEHIRQGVYKVQYTNIVYDKLLPINREVSPGKRDYTVRFMDQVGEAKLVTEGADDYPDVSASMGEKSMKSFRIGLGYSYDVDEVMAAMEEGIALPSIKAVICREQIERKINDVAMIGTISGTILPTAPQVDGLLTVTSGSVNTVTASTGSDATTSLGKFKAADDILADLNALANATFLVSKGKMAANTMLLPLTTKTELAARRVGDGTNGSILSYFVGSNQFIASEADVVGMWELESAAGASAGSAWTGKRAIAYRRDPACLEFIINQPFEQIAPQAWNTKVKTLCYAKCFRTGPLSANNVESHGWSMISNPNS